MSIESHTALDITDADFDAVVLQSAQPVLVDFWAPWCGPCKALAPIIDALAAEYAGRAKVVKLNADDNPEAVQKFGVRGLPTIIFFAQGNKHTAIAGAGHTKSEYAGILDHLLKDEPHPGASGQGVSDEINDQMIAALLDETDNSALEALLAEDPKLAYRPVEIAGVTSRPAHLAISARAGGKKLTHILDVLLPYIEDLNAVELAGLGRCDDLRDKLDKSPEQLNTAMGFGDTPLTIAIREGHSECVEFLLEQGADVNAGVGALYSAVSVGDASMVKRILAAGGDIHKVMEPKRDSLLHSAVILQSMEIIELLLSAGASVTEQNAEGSTPLDYADKIAEHTGDDSFKTRLKAV